VPGYNWCGLKRIDGLDDEFALAIMASIVHHVILAPLQRNATHEEAMRYTWNAVTRFS
jgi:hypothetical protein